MKIADLRVLLVQPDLYWLNPIANLEHLEQLLSSHSSISATDIVVLPEMFTSGFTQYPEPLDTGQTTHQTTIKWMRTCAKRWNTAITGSVACKIPRVHPSDTNAFVNRLLFVTSEGEVLHYDKCHLFQMGGEHERYQAGNQRVVILYKGWRLLLTICYDIRFPVFCRNQNDYDVLLNVANWPQSRRHAWRTLLMARAIENQAYVLGVNRIGTDGNGLCYQGDSMAISAEGEILADGHNGTEQLMNVSLSYDQLMTLKEGFPVSNDADLFKLL